MIKLFEGLLGLLFLIAAIDFISDPKKAAMEMSKVLNRPNPKFVNGHLVIPKHKGD